MYLSSVSNELRTATALLQQLRAEHEAAAALCLKLGLRMLASCKELREAKRVDWRYWRDTCLIATDLATLGTLGSVLLALEQLHLFEGPGAAAHDGVQRLAEGLGAGALPAVRSLQIAGTVCMWATQAPRHSPPPWAEAP